MSIRYLNTMTSPNDTVKTPDVATTFAYQFRNILADPNNLIRLVLFDTNSPSQTVLDRSRYRENLTLSMPAASLDMLKQGRLKILNFNSTGDYFEFDDSNNLTFGDGATDKAFSLVIYMNPSTSVSGTGLHTLAKRMTGSGNLGAEWYYGHIASPDRYTFRTFDQPSTNGFVGRMAPAPTPGVWQLHTATYSGNSTASGFKIYSGTTRIDDTNITNGVYTSMVNTTSKCGMFRQLTSGGYDQVMNAQYSLLAIVKEELSQTQVNNINDLITRFLNN